MPPSLHLHTLPGFSIGRRSREQVHVFGHVHNSHGIVRKDDTIFINAAQDENPQPIFFDIWV